MNIFKNLFLYNEKSDKNKDFNPKSVDQFIEIAKLVKEARIQQNLSLKELAYISKIHSRTFRKSCESQVRTPRLANSLTSPLRASLHFVVPCCKRGKQLIHHR